MIYTCMAEFQAKSGEVKRLNGGKGKWPHYPIPKLRMPKG
jgi:hypothetical protein